jgi:hypothetical protein
MRNKKFHIRTRSPIDFSFRFVVLPSSTYLFTAGVEGFCFSLDHTQTHTTVGGTPLDEGSARRRNLYLTTQTLYKTKKSIPPVGFEHTIPASARPQTYALDRAATGIGIERCWHAKYLWTPVLRTYPHQVLILAGRCNVLCKVCIQFPAFPSTWPRNYCRDLRSDPCIDHSTRIRHNIIGRLGCYAASSGGQVSKFCKEVSPCCFEEVWSRLHRYFNSYLSHTRRHVP